MKRVISFILTATLCMALCACGSTDTDGQSQDSNEDLEAKLAEYEATISELETKLAETEQKVVQLESQINTVSDSSSDEPEEAQDAGNSGFVKLNFGDSVELDFLEMTVDSASWSDELKPTDTSSVYSYMADVENETYFWLTGTMKNISGNSYDVEDIVAEIIFDNKYTYNAYLKADDGGNDFYGSNVKPLSSVKYYIYTSAPDEIRDIYSTVTIKFGFKADFSGSYFDEFDECNYLYMVELTK